MKKIAFRILAVLTIPAMLAGLAGCYPDEAASVSDLDIVITNYDSTYHFSGIQTYIMPDTVISITDPDNPDNNFSYSHEYDGVILSEMATQLNALGYQRVYDTVASKPDVAVVVSVSSTTYLGYYWYDWWYYWGWYPYWPYEYNNGFQYYYPWAVTYNYTVGTVFTTMIDLKPAVLSRQDSINVVWLGAINGLAEGSNIQTRVKKGIDQMFKQSPYL